MRQVKQKVTILAAMGGMLVFPVLALGDPAQVNARQLGVAEAVLHFCEPVDAEAAPKIKEKVKALENGASAESLAKVRASDDYRKGFDAETNFVSNVDQRNVKRLCSGAEKK